MRRRALLTTLGAALPIGVAGCTGLRSDGEETPEDAEPTATAGTTAETDAMSTPAETPTPTAAPGSVTLIDHGLVRSDADTPEELVRIVGAARNDGETALADLTAVARFRDGDGEFLETASAELDELAPGKKWQFTLVYPGSGADARAVAGYRLRIETDE